MQSDAMRFDVLTLFPAIFDGYQSQAILSKAIDRGLCSIHTHDFRGWTTDKHGSVDDRPYGGGPGMLLACEPVYRCVEHVQAQGSAPGTLVMLTPQGRRLTQPVVEELATDHDRLVLLCGRYEGFDERIRQGLQPLELSLGDFILNGGEVAAMAVIDAVVRLIPGVLGDETSAKYESFGTLAGGGAIEHPQFTRPRDFRGMTVPEVLLSGDHGRIEAWRAEQSQRRTEEVRRERAAESDAVSDDRGAG